VALIGNTYSAKSGVEAVVKSGIEASSE